MVSGWCPSGVGPVLRVAGSVALLLAVFVAVLAGACTTNPAGGCTCQPPNTACCVSHGKCCDPQYPHHCTETGKCYMYFTDAQRACGNNYEICGGAARATSSSPLPAGAGSLDVRTVPDRTCQ